MNRDDLLHALQDANVAAFLRVIRAGESSQDDSAYTVMYGGSHFESFATHPNILHGDSTAAGAYQFIHKTWEALAKQYGFKDFSPINQDCGAVALIAGRKALDDVLAGRLDEALRHCNQEWTSFQTLSQARAKEVFEAYGGRVGNQEPVATPARQIPSEDMMGPLTFVIPFLEAAASLIPALGKMFGSGTEVQQRNVAAGSIVADAIVNAVGAGSKEEALEKIQQDATALAKAKAAVDDILPQLAEAGGGGIEGARNASMKSDSPPLYKRGDFWFSLWLALIASTVIVDVLFFHPEGWSSEQRSQVLTIAGAVVMTVSGYWIGSTVNSQRKTELLAGKS